MIYRVLVHPQAAREAESAFQFIARGAPQNAENWYNRLIEKMNSLSEFPKRCPLARENQHMSKEIRQLLHGKYRILFNIDDARSLVRILHIRHGARQPLEKNEF